MNKAFRTYYESKLYSQLFCDAVQTYRRTLADSISQLPPPQLRPVVDEEQFVAVYDAVTKTMKTQGDLDPRTFIEKVIYNPTSTTLATFNPADLSFRPKEPFFPISGAKAITPEGRGVVLIPHEDMETSRLASILYHELFHVNTAQQSVHHRIATEKDFPLSRERMWGKDFYEGVTIAATALGVQHLPGEHKHSLANDLHVLDTTLAAFLGDTPLLTEPNGGALFRGCYDDIFGLGAACTVLTSARQAGIELCAFLHDYELPAEDLAQCRLEF